jgi:predicted Zn-dependent protease
VNEDQARAIIERALKLSQADDVEVSVGNSTEKAARFANNVITQNVSQQGVGVSVSVAFGQKVGHASTNDLSDEGLRSLVTRAEDLAKHAEPDSEYVSPPGPQTYPKVDGYFESTASLTHEARAQAIADAVLPSAKAGYRAAGSYTTQTGFSALGNSKGLFGTHRGTNAHYLHTVVTDDSSGWGECLSNDVSAINAAEIGSIAYQKAEASRNPVPLEPGAYTVVFEPAAFAGILSIANWTLQAKAAHEQRSAWRGKEGTKVGVDDLTIRTVRNCPELPTSPWIQQGLAAPDVTWIENGVLKTLAYDRFWAQKSEHEVTGGPSTVTVSGTDATTAELIAGVEKGVLVTRFWYIRFVDPMSLTITGMTRDGLFLIEDGKITKGLKNMRFNDSPLSVFQSITRFGQSKATALHGPMLAPTVVVDGFHFTSQTSF